MLPEGQEVLIGADQRSRRSARSSPSASAAILVEVLRDVTFRLAPTSAEDARAMVDGIRTAEVLRGVRGRPGVDREALADMIQRVSELVTDFPEITEVDLNPVLAQRGRRDRGRRALRRRRSTPPTSGRRATARRRSSRR